MTRARTPGHTERSTFAVCIAHVTGAATSDVPLDRDEQRAWLAERGIGLVPVADAATVRLAGAVDRPPSGARRRRPTRGRDVRRAVRRDLGPRRHDVKIVARESASGALVERRSG